MPRPYVGVTCRGSYKLGSACGRCERCADERQAARQSGPVFVAGGPVTNPDAPITAGPAMLPANALLVFNALCDAIRVRPNAYVMELLRRQLESLEDMADTADDRMEAEGLRMLIDMNMAIGRALALGNVKTATDGAING